SMTIAQLESMINQQKSRLADLRNRRKKIEKDLQDLDAEIARVEGGRSGAASAGAASAGASTPAPVGRGRRPRNGQPLPDVMEKVMSGSNKPMSVGEILEQ